jgi:hypothetical protein
MVNSQFEAILKGFEPFFQCPLEPDTNDSCLIKMGIGISIQIELDRSGQLLIGCRLGALPMSRYRNNLIQEALKSNGASLPSTGAFGFSQKSTHLILFLKLNTDLTPDQLSKIMLPFITKAKLWADAISKGETPTLNPSSSANEPSGLFGLISKK